jgi:hypothetical protein
MWNIPTIIIFVGALLSAFGALLSSFEQQKKDAEAAQLNVRIVDQQNELNRKNDELITLGREHKNRLSQIEQNVASLVSQGRLSKEDARAVLNVTLGDLKANIKGEVKAPGPN